MGTQSHQNPWSYWHLLDTRKERDSFCKSVVPVKLIILQHKTVHPGIFGQPTQMAFEGPFFKLHSWEGRVGGM